MRSLFTYILLMLSVFGVAQSFDVKGKVLRSLDQEPIENVSVVYEQYGKTFAVSITNGTGSFQIEVGKTGKLIFEHPAYYNDTLYIDAIKNVNAIEIRLSINFVELESANIFVNRPDTVFGSEEYNVEDFELLPNNELLLLSYKNRLDKSAHLRWLDEDHREKDKWRIVGSPKKLERDYLGNINLYTEKHIYQIECNQKQLKIFELPLEQFMTRIAPVEDTLGEDFYFSDYQWNYPLFQYYYFDSKDSTVHELPAVKDPQVAEIYFGEYYYLDNRDRVYCLKMEAETGVSRHIWANKLTGYPQSIMYKEVYAPFFKKEDTVMVFDHYQDHIYKYAEEDSLPCDSVAIDYHHSEKWKEWEQQLYQDPRDNQFVYALFQINTYFYLKKINVLSGEIEYITKLTHKYVKNLQIMDGFAYYVYRPFESLQNQFIYRERL